MINLLINCYSTIFSSEMRNQVILEVFISKKELIQERIFQNAMNDLNTLQNKGTQIF